MDTKSAKDFLISATVDFTNILRTIFNQNDSVKKVDTNKNIKAV
jgi:hypothetical protein